MVINCLLYGQVIYLSLQWWKWKRWEDIQQMGGRWGCMVAICRNTSFFFLPCIQKRQSGRTVLRWSSLFSLAPHLCHLRQWVPPPWPPRWKRASSASPAVSLRAPPLWRPDSCCTPWAGKKRKNKCWVESAGRKSGEELFTPSNPCQCCELRYFCSPWQLHDFPLSPSVWLCAGFILPLFARSSGTITCCAGWELTEKHGTTWLLINTETIMCQSQAAMVTKVEL